jgi:phosphoserine phosphatase RsbU/P
VPAEDVIERPLVTLAGYYEPAAACGGDWWTVHDLPEGKVLTLIGDVTGHGIASAILTGAAKAACDLARVVYKGKISCGNLLQLMNAAIYEAAKRQRMMTCVASILDPATRTVTVANAGHSFPLLVRRGTIRPLMSEGAPLGAAPAADYQASQVPVEPGDVLVWFTDGVTECENEGHEQFTERRLRALCLRVSQEDPWGIRDAISRELGAFTGGRPPADDMTFVVGRIH